MKKLVYLLVGIVAISSIRGELLAQGSLWGMIQRGGTDGAGVIFQTNPDGTGFTVKKNFSMEYSGAMPQYTQLTEANGKLYGMTLLGGATNEGVIFEFDPSNGRYTRKVDFAANVSKAIIV